MNENLYASPQRDGKTEAKQLRATAVRRFRITFLILLVAALLNYWAYDVRAVARLPVDLAWLSRVLYGVGFLLGGSIIWLLTIPLLEGVAAVIRIPAAGRVDADAWREALYESLNRAPYLGAGGALLWAVWVVGFYELRVDFHLISWLVGVPAHLLAACWYLPLLARWYRLAFPQSATT